MAEFGLESPQLGHVPKWFASGTHSSAVAVLDLGLRPRDPISMFWLSCRFEHHRREELASGCWCVQGEPWPSVVVREMLKASGCPDLRASLFRWLVVSNSSKTGEKNNQEWKKSLSKLYICIHTNCFHTLWRCNNICLNIRWPGMALQWEPTTYTYLKGAECLGWSWPTAPGSALNRSCSLLAVLFRASLTSINTLSRLEFGKEGHIIQLQSDC